MPTSHVQQIAQDGEVIVVFTADDHMGIDPFLRVCIGLTSDRTSTRCSGAIAARMLAR